MLSCAACLPCARRRERISYSMNSKRYKLVFLNYLSTCNFLFNPNISVRTPLQPLALHWDEFQFSSLIQRQSGPTAKSYDHATYNFTATSYVVKPYDLTFLAYLGQSTKAIPSPQNFFLACVKYTYFCKKLSLLSKFWPMHLWVMTNLMLKS